MSGFRQLSSTRVRFLGAWLVCLFCANALIAQEDYQIPQSEFIVPAGGQPGSEFEVTVHGKYLTDADKLLFGHPGIKAVPIKPEDKSDPIRPAKGTNSDLDSVRKFKITIAKDVPTGESDVRIVSARGMSRPLPFLVGEQPQRPEEESNDESKLAQEITINSVIHGVLITNKDADYYTFTGKKGQRVLISCLTTSVASKANPYVKVFDDTNRLIGIQHGYRGGDALVDCELPRDGRYFIRVSEYNYLSGGYDHYYRLQVTTDPWIDAVYPPVVRPGEVNELTVYGRNLPGGKVHPKFKIDGRPLEVLTTKVTPKIPAEDVNKRPFPPSHVQTLSGYEFRLDGKDGRSDPFWLPFTDSTIIRETKNDSADQAQEIAVPCGVVGQIEKFDDEDWYAIPLTKGQLIRIDLHGQTLGAPIDLQWELRLEREDKILTGADDRNKQSNVLFPTATRDPTATNFVAPEDGRYLLRITSKGSFFSAGPRYCYYLCLSQSAPDFQLAARPLQAHLSHGCILRQGSHQGYQVWAQRAGNFRGEIHLSVKGLPNGVTADPVVIPPNTNTGTLVVKAAGNAANWDGLIEIRGTANIKGKKVEHLAYAGTARWPNRGVTGPTLLTRSLALSVRPRPIMTLSASLPANTVIARGKIIRPTINVNRLIPQVRNTSVRVYALSPSPHLTISNLYCPRNRNSLPLNVVVRPDAFPGTYSVSFHTQLTVPFTHPKTRQRINVPTIAVSNPVTFTILPDKLADVTVEENHKVKAGDLLKLKVNVARQYDFADSYKIQLVLPPNTKGLSQVKEGTIAVNKKEGTLEIRVDGNATPGVRRNLQIFVVAMFQGKHEIRQFARCNIEVVK